MASSWNPGAARAPLALLTVALAVALTGCTAPDADSPDVGDAPTPTVAETMAAVPEPGSTSAAGTTAPEPEDEQAQDPIDSYLAWLEASRIPDARLACSYFTPELSDRVVAEARTEGWDVDSCEELTETSAELYRTFGVDADVEIDVVEQSADEAVLFVTYVSTQECGTVVMEPERHRWIMNHQTEGCDQG